MKKITNIDIRLKKIMNVETKIEKKNNKITN